MEFAAAERLVELGYRMLAVEGRLDNHEVRMTTMAELTQAALTELRSAIDEVAGELDALAGQVQADDQATAEAIRGQASRLRDLRPDTPEEPAPTP